VNIYSFMHRRNRRRAQRAAATGTAEPLAKPGVVLVRPPGIIADVVTGLRVRRGAAVGSQRGRAHGERGVAAMDRPHDAIGPQRAALIHRFTSAMLSPLYGASQLPSIVRKLPFGSSGPAASG
jgi:hypothetical protein